MTAPWRFKGFPLLNVLSPSFYNRFCVIFAVCTWLIIIQLSFLLLILLSFSSFIHSYHPSELLKTKNLKELYPHLPKLKFPNKTIINNKPHTPRKVTRYTGVIS